MIMECEYLKTCGFFKTHSVAHNVICQELINKYCKGIDMKDCKRLAFRKNYGTPPADHMLPSGLLLKSERCV